MTMITNDDEHPHEERQLRVLVVDDSLTVRMDLSEGLEAAGFAVTACGSIAEATKHIQDSAPAAAGKRFHLFILDVRLGDGDGIAVLTHIRSSTDEQLASTPVMFLSSESEVRDCVRGLTGGADEYAGKPYVLTYVVTRALELARSFRAKASQQHGDLPQVRGPTTLVIDDSLSYREAIREALEAAGYRAETAATGEEGLQKAALLRPAVVIVDGDLPGIDGTTVIRRLRLDAALRHIPCVMVTASGVNEMGAFEAGADASLLKQTSPNEVVARVRSLLSSAPQSTHARSVRSALGAANKVVVVGVGLQPVGDALRAEAYDVTYAKSADEALPLFDFDTPACLLVDAEDATECRRIRDALSNTVAIVALTRTGDDSQLAIDCLTAGADEVVARGTHAPLLVARVRAQLRRKQAEEEAQRERHEELARELILVENRTAQALAEERKRHLLEVERKNEELAIANAELEAFSYSVSHDLRAPLRAINGFSQALQEDCSHLLDQDGKDHLERILSATNRMNELIEDLLTLSRVSRQELRRVKIDMTALATSVAKDLVDVWRGSKSPVAFEVQPNLEAKGDPSLLRAVLENLIGNAFKFTSKREAGARIEVGAVDRPDGTRAFFVRDNGVGFDMKRAEKLFRPFQRLHTQQEFEGTGIGLATVQRIVIRHGGRAWAEASDGGACMWFTVSAPLGATDNG